MSKTCVPLENPNGILPQNKPNERWNLTSQKPKSQIGKTYPGTQINGSP